MECKTGENSIERGLDKLFKEIVKEKTAFFRSQQKNEPDLSDDEKYEIVSKLFVEKPSLFLSRYSNFMSKNDCQWFRRRSSVAQNSTEADEIAFYLSKLENSTEKSWKNKIRNRRYACLKRLIASTDYFSDYEMRQRHPLLFDQMIGKYQNENEMRQSFHSGSRNAAEAPFSTILLDFYDTKQTSDKKKQEKAEEDRTKMQLSDEEESDLGDYEDEDDQKEQSNKCTLSKTEKDHLREMFVHEMYESFLNGEDTEFDYSQVDTNEDYDMVDMMEKDEQDRYFDEDDD